MHEEIERPEVLIGSTYKIKTPVSDHAMYVTINDIVLNEGTRARAAPAVRGLHQLEEPRSLPVDRGADAHHLGRVPQGRRRHLPGGRAEGRVRPARRLLAAGRQVHAVDHRRARLRDREAPADHRPAARSRSSTSTSRSSSKRSSAEFEARNKQTDAFAKTHFPEGAQLCAKCSTAAVVHDGRLHDLPELRRFEVRVTLPPARSIRVGRTARMASSPRSCSAARDVVRAGRLPAGDMARVRVRCHRSRPSVRIH